MLEITLGEDVFAERVWSCVLLWRSHGAFQCPSVLCGSSARLAGIGMRRSVSESLISSGISGRAISGFGVPSGENEKRST